MGIRDRNTDALRMQYIIHADRFGFPSSTMIGAGPPTAVEFSTFGYGHVNIAAAGNIAGCLDFQFCRLFDPTEEIGVRIFYGTKEVGVAGDDITWIVQYDQCDFGEVLVAPSTNLDTPIGEHANVGGTTHELKITPRGIIDANTFDFTARTGAIAWEVEMDADSFEDDTIGLFGLALDYIPRIHESESENIDVFKDVSAA
jgi:hypothetical protein